MDIKIEYDGAYPNLCSGTLIVTINGKRWKFPPFCLSSGGTVWFDDEWSEHVESGPWAVSDWPAGFPDRQKKAVEDAVNEKIPEGCCGGCV